MNSHDNQDWLNSIKWNEDGLVPAIAQEAESGKVLCMAWMNREALLMSVQEKRAVYWSRSRQKLWRKGEESGHVQHLLEIRCDCDQDVVLLLVEQEGGIACHTGRHRCFYMKLDEGEWSVTDPVLRDPADIYPT